MVGVFAHRNVPCPSPEPVTKYLPDFSPCGLTGVDPTHSPPKVDTWPKPGHSVWAKPPRATVIGSQRDRLFLPDGWESLLRCCSDYSREVVQALRWASLQRTNNPRTSGLPGRENLSENEANVGPGLEVGESEGGETKSWHNHLRPGSSNDSAGFRSYTFQSSESVKPLFSFGGFGGFWFFLSLAIEHILPDV